MIFGHFHDTLRSQSIDLTHLMTQIRVINKSELISYARSVSAAVAVLSIVIVIVIDMGTYITMLHAGR